MVFCHMHSNIINRFLRLQSEYDWTFSALVVDINEDLSPKDEEEISVSFVCCKIVKAQITKIDCENILDLRKISKLINRNKEY